MPRSVPKRAKRSRRSALIPDLDTRNHGIPLDASPAPPPRIVTSQPHPDHPMVTVSDVQDWIAAAHGNGQKLDAANVLFQKILDVSLRQLEAIGAQGRQFDEFFALMREHRADVRALLDVLVVKKTNGSDPRAAHDP